MAKRSTRKASTKRVDVYQSVTDRIVEMLDQGTVPWRVPWSRGGGDGWPKNLTSGKGYRGINTFILALTAMAEGFDSDYWLTFKQAKQKGGQIRKGSKGSRVIYYTPYEIEDEATGDKKQVPVLKQYVVFNTDQCDGIDVPENQTPTLKETFTPIAEAEAIVCGFHARPVIEHGGNRAMYKPLADHVQMPLKEAFDAAENYYATLFHELTHSTGHAKRLDRGLGTKLTPFGSPDYSKEELVAEFGAAFLAAMAGISPPTIDQSAAYIAGWKSALKADSRMVIAAASAGQKAADWILGERPGIQPADAPQPPQRDHDAEASKASAAASVAIALGREADALDRGLVHPFTHAARAFPPPPANLDLARDADVRQLRDYVARVQRWYAQHLDQWIDSGLLESDPRRDPPGPGPTRP